MGKTLAEALPEVAEQGFVKLLDEVRNTGIPYRGTETWLKLQRGADAPLKDACLNFVYQPVHGADGQIDSIFVHAIDVTVLVRAREDAERLAHERQAAYDVLEHGDPVVILDSKWRFTFANAAWQKVARVTREDVLGKNHWEVFPATLDPKRQYVEKYHRAMRERAPVYFTERYIPLDLWTALNVYPTLDGGVAIFLRDVTSERRAEAEVQSRADFERQLIGIVSHDLRNPLSTILIGAQLLMFQDNLEPRDLKTVVRIKSAGERGARMVKDLLDFTQVRAGGGIPIALSPGNLHSVVRQAVDEAATTNPERVVNVTTTGDGDGKLDIDRLSQIMHNLLNNALKYSAPGSGVDVRCDSDAQGSTVTVHNVGEPIAAEALSRIFLPMQRATSQLENSARSVGLGLFIVKHLVEAHSGHVSVTSTAEHGTTFTFWVPKHPAVAPAAPPVIP
jgi:PAS domain S-box-containing protein